MSKNKELIKSDLPPDRILDLQGFFSEEKYGGIYDEKRNIFKNVLEAIQYFLFYS